MSGGEPENLIRVKTTYTFYEAIEYLKAKDKQTTPTRENIRWFDVKTGKQVVIGYNN